MSRPTLSELVWPMDDESRRQAKEWTAGVSIQVLDWTWRAFDALRANVLSRVDMSQPLEQLERDIRAAIPGAQLFTHLEPQGDPAAWEDIGLDRKDNAGSENN